MNNLNKRLNILFFQIKYLNKQSLLIDIIIMKSCHVKKKYYTFYSRKIIAAYNYYENFL